MDDDEQFKTILKKFSIKSEKWKLMETGEKGIFIVKFPQKEFHPSQIGLKFKKTQHPMEGYFIKSKREILLFQDLLNHNGICVFFNQMSIDKQLQKRIGMLKDWGQISTTVSGISFTKMKDYHNLSGVPAIAINPVNDLGKPIKKKNLFIRNIEELKKYRLLFNNEKLDRLSRIIDEVNDELSFEIIVAHRKVTRKYK